MYGMNTVKLRKCFLSFDELSRRQFFMPTTIIDVDASGI